MPLYKTITVSPYIKLLVWKVSEAEADLKKDLSLTPGSELRLEGMKSEIHRRAYLSIRHLLALMGYVDHDLFYDSSGKPHLTDGSHISITHSHHFTGIIISQKEEVGIDIEKQRPKIARIAHKFTPYGISSLDEKQEEEIKKLTIIWGAKESLYKIYGTPGLSFFKNIFVTDFNSITENKTTAKIIFEKRESFYTVSFLEFEGFTCVYALQNYLD